MTLPHCPNPHFPKPNRKWALLSNALYNILQMTWFHLRWDRQCLKLVVCYKMGISQIKFPQIHQAHTFAPKQKQALKHFTPERSQKICFHIDLPTSPDIQPTKTSPETLQSQGSHGCTMPCVPRSAQKSSPCRHHRWSRSRQNACTSF